MNKSKRFYSQRIQHDDDYSSYKIVYFIKASCKAEALGIVFDKGHYPEGKQVYSAYDCSGQHFCGEIKLRDVKWHRARKCYFIVHRWGIDI